jgi:hypothetical protein
VAGSSGRRQQQQEQTHWLPTAQTSPASESYPALTPPPLAYPLNLLRPMQRRLPGGAAGGGLARRQSNRKLPAGGQWRAGSECDGGGQHGASSGGSAAGGGIPSEHVDAAPAGGARGALLLWAGSAAAVCGAGRCGGQPGAPDSRDQVGAAAGVVRLPALLCGMCECGCCW